LTTRSEIQAQYVVAMGRELGEMCAALYHKVAWVHLRWALYKQLFGKSDRRIALLNETAGSFFGVLQGVLLDDVVLELARLVDSPKSCGKANLTLLRIPGLIADQELRPEIEAMVDSAEGACAKARDQRNRRLAHNDLSLAVETSAKPLPAIGIADVESALAAVRDLLNRLDSHYLNSTVAYEYVGTGPTDGDSLVHYLNKGLQAEQQFEDRIRTGQTKPEDDAWYEEV